MWFLFGKIACLISICFILAYRIIKGKHILSFNVDFSFYFVTLLILHMGLILFGPISFLFNLIEYKAFMNSKR